jgi:hypothetical protein
MTPHPTPTVASRTAVGVDTSAMLVAELPPAPELMMVVEGDPTRSGQAPEVYLAYLSQLASLFGDDGLYADVRAALDGPATGRDPALILGPLRVQARELGYPSLSAADRLLAWLCRPWEDPVSGMKWRTRYQAMRYGRVPFQEIGIGWDE